MDSDIGAEAQAGLDDAVREFMGRIGWDEPMLLTGWVLVAHLTDGGDRCGYPVIFAGGSLPDHQAVGLLQVGLDTARGVGRWGSDQE